MGGGRVAAASSVAGKATRCTTQGAPYKTPGEGATRGMPSHHLLDAHHHGAPRPASGGIAAVVRASSQAAIRSASAPPTPNDRHRGHQHACSFERRCRLWYLKRARRACSLASAWGREGAAATVTLRYTRGASEGSKSSLPYLCYSLVPNCVHSNPTVPTPLDARTIGLSTCCVTTSVRTSSVACHWSSDGAKRMSRKRTQQLLTYVPLYATGALSWAASERTRCGNSCALVGCILT